MKKAEAIYTILKSLSSKLPSALHEIKSLTFKFQIKKACLHRKCSNYAEALYTLNELETDLNLLVKSTDSVPEKIVKICHRL